MEALKVELNADMYDAAVEAGLPECGDLAFYVKPGALVPGD